MKISKRVWPTVFVVLSAAVLASVFLQPNQHQVSSSAAPITEMTEWFYADGIIQPDDINLKDAMRGVWAPTKEWVVLFNLSPNETTVTATFYFEDMPPRQTTQKLGGRSSESIAVQDIPEVVPPKKLYGVRIQSTGPIIVQPTRGEYEPSNPVTHAMASFVAYPGPLSQKETKWIYADGLVMTSDGPLEEREWITILNPNPGQEAHVKITFNFTNIRGLIKRQKTHQLTVPAERVRTVDLFNLPVFPKNKVSAPIIESDVPVVVEQVRRAYAKGIPVITAMWACMAYPIGDKKID